MKDKLNEMTGSLEARVDRHLSRGVSKKCIDKLGEMIGQLDIGSTSLSV